MCTEKLARLSSTLEEEQTRLRLRPSRPLAAALFRREETGARTGTKRRTEPIHSKFPTSWCALTSLGFSRGGPFAAHPLGAPVGLPTLLLRCKHATTPAPRISSTHTPLPYTQRRLSSGNASSWGSNSAPFSSPVCRSTSSWSSPLEPTSATR